MQRKGVKCIFWVCRYEYISMCMFVPFLKSIPLRFLRSHFYLFALLFQIDFLFSSFFYPFSTFSLSQYTFFFIKTHKATHGKTHNIMNKKCAAFLRCDENPLLILVSMYKKNSSHSWKWVYLWFFSLYSLKCYYYYQRFSN